MRNIVRFFVLVLSGYLLPNTSFGADLNFYGVIKQENYVQDNPLVPHLDTDSGSNNNNSNNQSDGPLKFSLIFDANSGGTPTSASVTVPGGAVKTAGNGDGSDDFGYNDSSYGSKLDWDTAYPSGTYTVSMTVPHDVPSNKTIPLTLPADSYPAIPFISNYSQAQSVDSTSDFTIQFPAAVTAIHVSLQVSDNNGNEFNDNGTLTQSSTSFLIHAGTMQPGTVYTAKLQVVSGFTDTTSYSGPGGAIGVAAYARQTTFTIKTAGGSDTTAPYLVATSPQWGDTGVAVNSLVAFQFSEPMQSGVSINWTNAIAADFSYTWSADKTTLFCKYTLNNGDLPQNAHISWGLNGSSFHDLANNPLGANPNGGNFNAATLSGDFTTANQSPAATDVSDFGLVKGITAVQKSSSGPVADGGYQFNAFADFSGVNTVTNSTLTWSPNGSSGTVPITTDVSDSADQVGVSVDYLSKADLDKYFPSGTYTLALSTAHDGLKNASFTLPADNYPSLPNVSNYNAAQAVNPASAFTLTWNSFSGTSSDVIGIEIKHPITGDNVFKIEPNNSTLNGTMTQVTIPVGKLAPGRTYKAKLTFVKVSTQTVSGYTGPTVLVGYATQTTFTLTTTGTPIVPSLKVLSVDPISHNFSLRLQGERNLQYTIERTFDLVNPGWSSATSMNANNPTNTYEGTFDFTDGGVLFNNTQQFYRAIEGSDFQNNNNNN